MGCIFYDGEICLAQHRTIKKIQLFRPTATHRKAFCETPGYTVCPRYAGYVARLKRVKEGQEAKPSTAPRVGPPASPAPG